jgi:hypothetical protein
MAINPCAWNQVVNPEKPYPTHCRATWVQYGWYDYEKGLIVGREDIASAIATAEEMLSHALAFPIAPTYVNSDEVLWIYPRSSASLILPTLTTNNGYVLEPGREAFTEVALFAPVVYTDRDGDGVNDTATITITAAQLATAGASWYELAVYYPEPYLDFYLFGMDDTQRIRPLKIVLNPTTGAVTISGNRCQFVRPDLWLNDNDIRQDLDTNFVSYVNVYRRYTDPSQQAQIVYRTGVGSCGEGACAESCQAACMQVTDKRLGEVKVSPATYSSGSFIPASFTDTPHAVRLWYLAGYHRQRNGFAKWIEADWMEPRLAKAIVALSLADIPDNICGCSQTRQLYAQWTEEMPIDNLNAAMAQQYFGYVTRGSIFAANVVESLNPIVGVGNV